MIETRQYYPHMDVLFRMFDMRYDYGSDVRKNKERLIAKLGLTSGVKTRRESFVVATEGRDDQFLDFIKDELGQGNYLSLLTMKANHASMGGCPVTYLSDKGEFCERLVVKDGRLASFTAQGGEIVKLDEPHQIVAFSRKRSQSGKCKGFDNYKEELEVRLGGGFRLQVDNIEQEDDGVVLVISSVWSFNDRGSRVLALSSVEDQNIPRFSLTFRIRIDASGKFMGIEFPTSLPAKEISEVDNVNLIIERVVESLFSKYGDASLQLFKGLLSTRPCFQIHQFEGMYSVVNNQPIVEIIDFDGIDSFDLIKDGDQPIDIADLKPTERLVRSRLRTNKLALSDAVELNGVVKIQREVNEQLGQLRQANLPEEILTDIDSHFQDKDGIFTHDKTAAVKLGRLLKTLKIDWQHNGSSAKVFGKEVDKIFFIEISGFALGYWYRDGKWINTNIIEENLGELSRVTKKQITKAHLNYLREGD